MPDEERKTIFAKNFNEAMEKKGIRQIDIVKNLGFNSSTVSNWSKGVMLPRSDKLKVLSNYLGVSAAQLMGWSENYEFKDMTSNSLNIDAIRRAIDKALPSEQAKKDVLNKIISQNLNTDDMCSSLEIEDKKIDAIWLIKQSVLNSMEKLNIDGQKKVKEYADDLAENPKYRKGSDTPELNAAHARTDVDIPEGADTSDNDIMDDKNF